MANSDQWENLKQRASPVQPAPGWCIRGHGNPLCSKIVVYLAYQEMTSGVAGFVAMGYNRMQRNER